jgi:oligoribonuclease NrnB/cAMP/cGMP phosphodiesterase (DHH superfamily)
MKNYVVGILSMFENDLKLFKITADNEYEAVKKGMIEFCHDDVSKVYEIAWQNSSDYPKDLKGLYSAYEEVPFNVIEI